MIKKIIFAAIILFACIGFANADSAIPSSPYFSLGTNPWSTTSWSDGLCNKSAMDFLVILDPSACSPAVVRSDLLEEQDVPVMCRLTGIKINPLIQVPYIKNIVVNTENRSSGISYVSFYPARTSLTSQYYSSQASNSLEGVPTMNNLGYLWIQLAQQPVESKMPDSVKLSANAEITYDVAQTYGISENQFVMPVMSNDEWLANYKQYNFWHSKGYVRLMNVTSRNNARIAVYTNYNSMPQIVDLHVGDVSQEVILPGFYCGAGVKVRLDGIDTPKDAARILVNGNEEIVRAGEKISDSGCDVATITPSPGYGGSVAIRCASGQNNFQTLTIKDFGATLTITDNTEDAGNKKPREQSVIAGSVIPLSISEAGKPQVQYYLYTGFVGKMLDSKEGLIGFAITFNKISGQKINEDEKNKIVSAIHDYMKAQRGDALGVAQMGDKSLEESLRDYLIARKIANAEDYQFSVRKKGASSEFMKASIFVKDIEGPEQATYGAEVEKSYKDAIDEWKSIQYEYSSKPGPEGMWYGIVAMRNAYDLASYFHKGIDEAELLKTMIDKYTGSDEPLISNEVDWAREELRRVVSGGSGNKYATFTTSSGSIYSIELLGIEKASSMEYSVLEIEKDGQKSTGQYSRNDYVEDWQLISVEDNSITLSNTTLSMTINKGDWVRLDGSIRVRVAGITRTVEAKVTVLPMETERKTEVNFTVQIGIEKRAIKLSPAQAKDNIAKLNSTISALQKINNGLGTTISWWKKACYAGAGALWIKNIVTGMSGETLARKMVMESWSKQCSDTTFRKTIAAEKNVVAEAGRDVISIDLCYRLAEDKINADVKAMKKSIDDSNSFIKSIKAKDGVVKSCGLFGLLKCVDDEKFMVAAQDELDCVKKKTVAECTSSFNCELKEGEEGEECVAKQIIEYKNGVAVGSCANIAVKGGTAKCADQKDEAGCNALNKLSNECSWRVSSIDSSVLIGKISELNKNNMLYKDDVKEIYLDLALYKQCEKTPKAPMCINVMNSAYTEYKNYQRQLDEYEVEKEATETFGRVIPNMRTKGTYSPPAEIFSVYEGSTNFQGFDQAFVKEFVTKESGKNKGKTAALFGVNSNYWLAIVDNIGGNYFKIIEKTPLEKADSGFIEVKNEAKITAMNKGMENIFDVQETDFSKCGGNTIKQGPEAGEKQNIIKFWENSVAKGVAYMPIGEGWYVATTSDGWKENGDIQKFTICDVGANGIPEFNFGTGTGTGDDAQCCKEVDLNTGTYPDVEAQAAKAKKCMAAAMTAFKAGQKTITACGQKYSLGKAPVAVPNVQCENFMSPTDCNIIYNLCDPVMCPSSRCNFAGRIQVDNVKQSGILGSIMLCLPNFENGKGVLVPVCLDGVHEGIANLITVLNATRDCLNENLKTGKTVGICDQMTSIYMCELFWKQLAPFVQTGLPSITTSLTGNGGGEYAIFGESWKHGVESARYFTEQYGIQTFNAFKARSTNEVASEVCKKFVGMAYPNQAKFWDELSKPESYQQATACFQEIPLGGPSTDSHYKVYFHIKASDDAGTYYQIWLRRPAQPGYNPPAPEYLVKDGFGYIQAGGYADATPDFTAPSGYKEIVVRINEQEITGFGDCASTDFAITQLENYYVESQVKENIQTSDECSEGKASVFPTPALLVGNIQSAVENAVSPELYKRGVVRVCSSQNPGGGVNENWKSVGYCDSKQIFCWLSLSSLNESVSDLGIRDGLYKYAESADIAHAINDLGMDTRDASKAKLDAAEALVIELNRTIAIAINDWTNKFKNAANDAALKTLKKEYQAEIGYNSQKDATLPLGKIASYISDATQIRNNCAHPDEKARADWLIGRLTDMKARLLAAGDIIELQKKGEDKSITTSNLFNVKNFAIPWDGKAELSSCKDYNWAINLPNVNSIIRIPFSAIVYSISPNHYVLYSKDYGIWIDYTGVVPSLKQGESVVGKGEIGKSNGKTIAINVYSEYSDSKKTKINPALIFDETALKGALSSALPENCKPTDSEKLAFSVLMQSRGYGASAPAAYSTSNDILLALEPYLNIIKSESDANLPDNPKLLAAVIYQESKGNPDAISESGAAGLAQFSFATASDSPYKGIFGTVEECTNKNVYGSAGITAKCNNYDQSDSRYRCCSPLDGRFNPSKSIHAAAIYLELLIAHFKPMHPDDYKKLAIASYNVGPGNIDNAIKAYNADPKVVPKATPGWETIKPYLKNIVSDAKYNQVVEYVDLVTKYEISLEASGMEIPVETPVQTGTTVIFKWPVVGGIIRDSLGYFGDSRDYGKSAHAGIDILGSVGTPVLAVEAGTAEEVVNNCVNEKCSADCGGDAGNYIIIKHLMVGTSGKFVYSKYMHLDTIAIKKGSIISKGMKIGTIGKTGNACGYAIPAHLHLEIHIGSESNPQNPLCFFSSSDLASAKVDSAKFNSGSCSSVLSSIGITQTGTTQSSGYVQIASFTGSVFSTESKLVEYGESVPICAVADIGGKLYSKASGNMGARTVGTYSEAVSGTAEITWYNIVSEYNPVRSDVTIDTTANSVYNLPLFSGERKDIIQYKQAQIQGATDWCIYANKNDRAGTKWYRAEIKVGDKTYYSLGRQATDADAAALNAKFASYDIDFSQYDVTTFLEPKAYGTVGISSDVFRISRKADVSTFGGTERADFIATMSAFNNVPFVYGCGFYGLCSTQQGACSSYENLAENFIATDCFSTMLVSLKNADKSNSNGYDFVSFEDFITKYTSALFPNIPLSHTTLSQIINSGAEVEPGDILFVYDVSGKKYAHTFVIYNDEGVNQGALDGDDEIIYSSSICPGDRVSDPTSTDIYNGKVCIAPLKRYLGNDNFQYSLVRIKNLN